MKDIRVRFAPSPTGPLHIGGVRTALYNYLFAKKNNGKFILRIEDTDQTRFVEGAEDYIVEALRWCGLEFDEGVNIGGDFGPYKQSERKELYKKHADILIENGNAYYAFDTPEELDVMRKNLEATKASNMSYSSHNRKQMRNSLSLSKEETDALLSSGAEYVIRFKMPENEEIVLNDIIRGEVKVNTSTLDDKVLFKSDGMPTYHLANIVDDHLMEISHVIRGEEWLPSMSLHIMLYNAFKWEAPQFAHLPLLLKPEGNGKLSKRDGDKHGFPVFPIEWNDKKSGSTFSGYREDGYFADAFINMLALLGWNPGTEQEILSMDDLINQFDLNHCNKSGARFNPEKTIWFNQQYLRTKENKELAEEYNKILVEKGIEKELEYTIKIVDLVKERANFISDFWEQSDFFYLAPTEYDAKTVKKRWKENTPNLMKDLIGILEAIEEFSSANTEEKVKLWITENELSMGAIMNAFRLCIVGAGKGPHMFDIIEMIGKEETLKRLKDGIDNIKK